jgi:hypothetical protein
MQGPAGGGEAGAAAAVAALTAEVDAAGDTAAGGALDAAAAWSKQASRAVGSAMARHAATSATTSAASQTPDINPMIIIASTTDRSIRFRLRTCSFNPSQRGLRPRLRCIPPVPGSPRAPGRARAHSAAGSTHRISIWHVESRNRSMPRARSCRRTPMRYPTRHSRVSPPTRNRHPGGTMSGRCTVRRVLVTPTVRRDPRARVQQRKKGSRAPARNIDLWELASAATVRGQRAMCASCRAPSFHRKYAPHRRE